MGFLLLVADAVGGARRHHRRQRRIFSALEGLGRLFQCVAEAPLEQLAQGAAEGRGRFLAPLAHAKCAHCVRHAQNRNQQPQQNVAKKHPGERNQHQEIQRDLDPVRR